MIVRAVLLASLPMLQAVPGWTIPGGGEFGRSLAILDADGDGTGELLVGAPDQASAFLFKHPGVTPVWTVQGPARFGFRVAPAGDVNGDGFEDAAVADLDRSYVYLGSAAGLATAAAWTAPGTVPAGVGDVNGDGFDDVAVGSPSSTLGGVDVYLGSASGLSTSPVWSVVGPAQPVSLFGATIAAAGDVDGDGFDDFLVGAPGHDRVLTTVDVDAFYSLDDILDPVDLPVGVGIVPDTGRAWLIAGSPDGPEQSPRWTALGTPQRREAFGTALAGGADVDADGRPDVVIASARPEVVAFFASGPGLSPSPGWIHLAQRVDSELPVEVGMGDVNGDGVGDLVVVDRHSLRVFEGPLLTGGLAFTSGDPAVAFRASLAVGDLDGDGFDDVATAGHGEVRVFSGAATPAPPAPAADPGTAVAAAAGGTDERSTSDGCGLLGLEALLALAYLSSRMRRARNQTSSP